LQPPAQHDPIDQALLTQNFHTHLNHIHNKHHN